jgi:hypothetical protein
MEYYSGVHEISDNLGIANRNRPGEAVAGKLPRCLVSVPAMV